MKIALIGATGFVGKALLTEFINRGFEVLAMARNTANVPKHEGVSAANLDVTNTKNLAALIQGYDVVVSAFNAGWTNPNLYNDLQQGLKSIQAAVEQSGVKRLIVIGGAGTMKIDNEFIVDGPDFPKEIYPGASSVRDYFVNTLRSNNTIDWTYFSPAIEMHPGITTGRTGKYRLGNNTPVFDEEGRSVLSVEDLAVAIADEVENHNYSREQFTAGY